MKSDSRFHGIIIRVNEWVGKELDPGLHIADPNDRVIGWVAATGEIVTCLRSHVDESMQGYTMAMAHDASIKLIGKLRAKTRKLGASQ